MPEEPNPPPGDAAGDSAGRLARARATAAHARRTISTRHGESSVAEVNLSDEHIASAIALQSQALENEDRRSEREHNTGRESRRQSFILAIIAISAVVGIIVFLTIYRQAGLLGYILSGIGGLIAGAFGGYGYARR